MRDCALSTSGSEEQCFVRDGHRYGHIIDPRSGIPADKVATVTVIAPSAAVSDALATAFYVGGEELAERYCRDHKETVVMVLESGAERPVIFGRNANCEVQIV
jgi:thiamine biosynthesis lipoprotein